MDLVFFPPSSILHPSVFVDKLLCCWGTNTGHDSQATKHADVPVREGHWRARRGESIRKSSDRHKERNVLQTEMRRWKSPCRRKAEGSPRDKDQRLLVQRGVWGEQQIVGARVVEVAQVPGALLFHGSHRLSVKTASHVDSCAQEAAGATPEEQERTQQDNPLQCDPSSAMFLLIVCKSTNTKTKASFSPHCNHVFLCSQSKAKI